VYTEQALKITLRAMAMPVPRCHGCNANDVEEKR
jgi:hypothetical protein